MRYNGFLHIFPEQCAKYLHDKFKMHSELTVRELMVILKRIGIKTIKIHNNGKIYDVFYKREIDGIQDFEFLNNLHQYRRDKQIRDEWSKVPLTDYTSELSNMQNASDELLRQDDVYYTNESQNIKLKYNNMKKDNKKALYESIMNSVAKEVKKALNENLEENEGSHVASKFVTWLSYLDGENPKRKLLTHKAYLQMIDKLIDVLSDEKEAINFIKTLGSALEATTNDVERSRKITDAWYN